MILLFYLLSEVTLFRVKRLKEPVYTQQEADAAGGLGVYKPPTKPTHIQPVLQPASSKQNVNVDMEGLSLV